LNATMQTRKNPAARDGDTGCRRCMGNDCSLRSLAQQGGNVHPSPDSNHLHGALADLGDYGLWSALFADSGK
jgi:hypothetical protein